MATWIYMGKEQPSDPAQQAIRAAGWDPQFTDETQMDSDLSSWLASESQVLFKGGIAFLRKLIGETSFQPLHELTTLSNYYVSTYWPFYGRCMPNRWYSPLTFKEELNNFKGEPKGDPVYVRPDSPFDDFAKGIYKVGNLWRLSSKGVAATDRLVAYEPPEILSRHRLVMTENGVVAHCYKGSTDRTLACKQFAAQLARVWQPDPVWLYELAVTRSQILLTDVVPIMGASWKGMEPAPIVEALVEAAHKVAMSKVGSSNDENSENNTELLASSASS